MKQAQRHLSLQLTALLTLVLMAATSSAQNVLTRQNDIGRTGRQLNETTLTTSNVVSGTFGKVFTYSVSGQIYAQPLAVKGLSMTGCHAALQRRLHSN